MDRRFKSMKKFFLASIFLLTISLNSCLNNEENIVCTTEFKTIYVRVNRDTLDNFHTIRVSTGDTLIIKNNSSTPYMYPVINDSLKVILKNKFEKFRFQGYLKDSIIIDEEFQFSANDCHVEFRSGNLIIN